MKYFVETEVLRSDCRLVVHRTQCYDELDAVKSAYIIACEAFGVDVSDAIDFKLNYPMPFYNDFGEPFIITAKCYGELAQVTEGYFVL